MYPFDAGEFYFISNRMGTFDCAVFFRLGKRFVESLKSLLDAIANGKSYLSEEYVSSTMD